MLVILRYGSKVNKPRFLGWTIDYYFCPWFCPAPFLLFRQSHPGYMHKSFSFYVPANEKQMDHQGTHKWGCTRPDPKLLFSYCKTTFPADSFHKLPKTCFSVTVLVCQTYVWNQITTPKYMGIKLAFSIGWMLHFIEQGFQFPEHKSRHKGKYWIAFTLSYFINTHFQEVLF